MSATTNHHFHRLLWSGSTVQVCIATLTLMAMACAAAEPNNHSGQPVAVIEGVENRVLRTLLRDQSVALWQSPQPPDSEIVLRGSARRYQGRLMQVLTSEGYYAAHIDFDVVWSDTARQVVYQITPGTPYRFDAVNTVFRETPETTPTPPPLQVSTGLELQGIARAQAVLDGEQRLRTQLTNGGYPFARVYDRRVVVNHDTHTVNVTFHVASGPRLYFGPPRIEGLDEVRPETVHRELPWREGDLYRAKLLREAQEKLQRTGLFSVVRVRPAQISEVEHEQTPIIIEVTERLHRSVSVGLQYRTDEGMGLGGQWEHRNFLRRGRRLRIQGNLTELEQNLGAIYDIPQFRRPDQTLTLHAKGAQLDPDAYRSRRFDTGAWVERSLTPQFSLGLGVALRLSRVTDSRQTRQYYLFSTPFQAAYDRRNDPLDPTGGYRATNRITPFVDVTGIDTHFVKNELNVSHYLPLPLASDLLLATRLRLGVMGGASLGEIPADERFYAGGGGSIRGYAYQKVGPLDPEANATGGRSITDWSVELRKRINESFGVVVFVDGGMAHESILPDFKDEPQWGVGVGARYFTPIGPLRFDVAAPVNKRKELDSTFQFYISIGQAF